MLKCPFKGKECMKAECVLWDREGQDCCFMTINRSLLIAADTADHILREGVRFEDRFQ